MDIAFRPTPNGTIRLTAVTAQGAAPVLANLPAGSGCTVMIWNRGTVPVSVAFGRNAAMDLPALPTDTVGGARTIPAGAATLQRLQQGERHVAIAASGTPDVEFTVGEGGSDVFAIPGAVGTGGGGGGQTGSVTAAGSNGTQAQAIQGINNGVPVPTLPVQLDTVDTYAINGTGPTPGIRLAGYGSVLAEMMGTFSLNGALQFSTDTTDGVDGTWTDGFGFVPENAGGIGTATALTSATRKRYYRADGTWVRFNAISFASGSATLKIVRKVAVISERAINVGGGFVALTAGSATIGGVLSASTFSEAFRTAQAANATLNGVTRDLGAVTGAYTRFGALAVSDQAGTLQLQASTDGSNWISVASQAVAAGTPLDLSVPVRARYYRAVFVNGATAATVFSLLTSFTAS